MAKKFGVLSFIVGAGVGAVAGMLYCSKKGESCCPASRGMSALEHDGIDFSEYVNKEGHPSAADHGRMMSEIAAAHAKKIAEIASYHRPKMVVDSTEETEPLSPEALNLDDLGSSPADSHSEEETSRSAADIITDTLNRSVVEETD